MNFLFYSVEVFTVDFLIPDLKLIIETHGFHHYIKKVKNAKLTTFEQEFNLNTEFKNKCLRDLGYKILNVEGQRDLETSFDFYFFELFEKFFKANF